MTKHTVFEGLTLYYYLKLFIIGSYKTLNVDKTNSIINREKIKILPRNIN